MKLHEVTEDQTAKKLAYIFQQVYRDEHDFNFVLSKKDGYIVGELISKVTGKPFNDVIVFLGGNDDGGSEVLVIDDMWAYRKHTIPEIISSAIGHRSRINELTDEAVSSFLNSLHLKI